MATRVIIHRDRIRKLYATQRDPVLRWVTHYVERVTAAAVIRCPKDTGHLASTIHYEFIGQGTSTILVRIGTNVEYARWVHDGTGIYGPEGKRIYPKKKKALAWGTHSFSPPTAVVKGKHVGGSKSLQPTGVIIRRSVAGMKPRPFLADALHSTHIS